MSFFEDLFSLPRFKTEAQSLSDLLFRGISESMAATCDSSEDDSCRDDSAARTLKFAAIASILVAGMFGVAIPLVGKHRRFLFTDSNLFVAARAFAAGVILATGFVHMLAGGSEALSNSCLPERPWKKFPFSGFFAMMAALLTLLVDFVGTQYYERKQGLTRINQDQVRVGFDEPGLDTGVVPVLEIGEVLGEQKDGGVHIVALHAHVGHHSNSHAHGHRSGHGHGDGYGSGDEDTGSRHVVVSQILELGIVSHSVIIGLSLGVSESPCTIRPLIAALSFHQFFEGFALGGCISQAQFSTLSATLMACFFAITTPSGIVIGMAISSFYNPYSQGALIAEGILDSLSAGILVYMALVDLIAADFLSKKMSCNFRLQLVSYFMLFVGAGMMSALAIWA